MNKGLKFLKFIVRPFMISLFCTQAFAYSGSLNQQFDTPSFVIHQTKAGISSFLSRWTDAQCVEEIEKWKQAATDLDSRVQRIVEARRARMEAYLSGGTGSFECRTGIPTFQAVARGMPGIYGSERYPGLYCQYEMSVRIECKSRGVPNAYGDMSLFKD